MVWAKSFTALDDAFVFASAPAVLSMALAVTTMCAIYTSLIAGAAAGAGAGAGAAVAAAAVSAGGASFFAHAATAAIAATATEMRRVLREIEVFDMANCSLGVGDRVGWR